MDDSQAEIRELKRLVEELLARVLRLEKLAGVAGDPRKTTESGPGPVRLEVVPSPGDKAPPARNNLEARIGSHWLNRIGIAALLIGVSYFLKYAFESNWIGPAAQILIGIVAGVTVVVWSEWFRRRGYGAFSYSLKAVGIGALYLSLWAAVQVYSLLSVGMAFSGMVVVTAATAIFALLQNAEILAAFSLAGGFATPVSLATGHNREVQLFAYLALLDAATLAMFLSRGWPRLLLLSFSGTAALYFGWYAEFYSRGQFGSAFAFATLFFAIFAFATMLGGGVSEGVVPRVLLAAAAFNGVAYFLQGYLMLETEVGRARFAGLLAVLYLLLARQRRSRSRLRGAHLALAVAFLTLALALRLHEVWISLGWFVEASLLMAAGFWRKSSFVRWLALVLIAAATLKVFAYDIWNLSRGYRILSFVFLGVLLLAVSFAYQRDWLKLSRMGRHGERTSVET